MFACVIPMWVELTPGSWADPHSVGEQGLHFRALWILPECPLPLVLVLYLLVPGHPEPHFGPSPVASHSILPLLRASWLMTQFPTSPLPRIA